MKLKTNLALVTGLIISICGFYWLKFNPKSPLGWTSVGFPPFDHHASWVFEVKRTSPIHDEYHRRFKIVFDARSFGDSIYNSIINLPPSLGGGFRLEIYIKDRELIHVIEGQQFHVIDLKNKCLRTSIKGPDLLGPLCDFLSWVKLEDFRVDQVKHLGTIHGEWSNVMFIPAQGS